jgi:hypothetical protein
MGVPTTRPRPLLDPCVEVFGEGDDVVRAHALQVAQDPVVSQISIAADCSWIAEVSRTRVGPSV